MTCGKGLQPVGKSWISTIPQYAASQTSLHYSLFFNQNNAVLFMKYMYLLFKIACTQLTIVKSQNLLISSEKAEFTKVQQGDFV